MAEGTARGLPRTSGAGWVTTSYEVMKMKAVNHKPIIRLEGTIAFKAVRMSEKVFSHTSPAINRRKIIQKTQRLSRSNLNIKV